MLGTSLSLTTQRATVTIVRQHGACYRVERFITINPVPMTTQSDFFCFEVTP